MIPPHTMVSIDVFQPRISTGRSTSPQISIVTPATLHSESATTSTETSRSKRRTSEAATKQRPASIPAFTNEPATNGSCAQPSDEPISAGRR